MDDTQSSGIYSESHAKGNGENQMDTGMKQIFCECTLDIILEDMSAHTFHDHEEFIRREVESMYDTVKTISAKEVAEVVIEKVNQRITKRR